MESPTKTVDEDSDRIPDTTMACCILHNICITRGIIKIDIEDDDNDDGDSGDDKGIPLQGAQGIYEGHW